MTKALAVRNLPGIRAILRDRDSYLDPFDRVFDDIMRDSFPDFFKSFGIETLEGGYPKVNILSYPDRIVIEAEIAGMKKDDVSLDIHNEHGEKYITISGKSSQTTEETDKSVYLRRELKRTSFSRTFRLGNQLDDSKVDAKFDNGLLTVTIPKLEKEIQSQRVEIK